MSVNTSSAAPPGWYPDPSGSRQWRVWTGTTWSQVTRPYGERATEGLHANLGLVQALRRMSSAGVVGVLGGLGLLVSVLTHWPGTADPAPHWFAVSASSLAVSLLTLGTVVYAFGVKELRGRWTIDALVPGVNLLVTSALVAQRLGRTSVLRVTAEIALIVVFVTSAHGDVWLGLAPVVVAFGQTVWLRTLVDQLNVSSAPDRANAS